jgi:predicted phage tail protein
MSFSIANALVPPFMKQFLTEFQQLKQESQANSAILRELKASNESRDQIIAELRSQNDLISQQVAELRSQNDLISQQVAELRSQNDLISQQVAELRSQNDLISQQVAELREENAQLARTVARDCTSCCAILRHELDIVAENAAKAADDAAATDKKCEEYYGELFGFYEESEREGRSARRLVDELREEMREYVVDYVDDILHGSRPQQQETQYAELQEKLQLLQEDARLMREDALIAEKMCNELRRQICEIRGLSDKVIIT